MISIRDDKAEVENARLDACTREAYRHDEFKVSLCYSLDVMFEKLVVNVRSRLILSIRELRVITGITGKFRVVADREKRKISLKSAY